MKRPVGVTVISAVAIVGGLLQMVSAFGYLILPAMRTPFLFGAVTGIAPALLFWTGLVSLTIGVAAIAGGVGALSLKRWAWVTNIVVWAAALVFGVISMIASGVALIPGLTVICSIVILAYLSTAKVFELFGVQRAEHVSTHHPSAV